METAENLYNESPDCTVWDGTGGPSKSDLQESTSQCILALAIQPAGWKPGITAMFTNIHMAPRQPHRDQRLARRCSSEVIWCWVYQNHLRVIQRVLVLSVDCDDLWYAKMTLARVKDRIR